MLLLINNLHGKRITERKDRQNFLQGTLLVICTHITTLHLCYVKNALIFSQSEVCDFFHPF